MIIAMPAMERADQIDALSDAMSRFADLVADADGDEPVLSCDGWTVQDLVLHLGSVHRMAAATVLSGARGLTEPAPLVRGSLADWYAGCAGALLSAVDAVDPDEPVPNFSRMRETAAFWTTRQLHETVVHAVDAGQALGGQEAGGQEPWGVTPEVAAHGIEEVLGVWFPRMTARGERPDVRARVRLDSIDRDESWIIGPGSDPAGPPVQLHGTVDVDTSARGTTVELYLTLWGRLPIDRLSYDSPEARAVLAGPRTG